MLSSFEHFRNEVYAWFSHRQDALMDLLDALSSTTTARSVVELSLSPLFRRAYCSVFDAIDHLFVPDTETSRLQERRDVEQTLVHLLMPVLPTPQRSFWLFGTDVTSASRPFARTLSDRTFVYHPNPVKGVKPVTIGHQYSVVALLPEKVHPDEPPWVLPLLVNRVASTETKRAAGLAQLGRLLDDEALPFHKDLCVNVADSEYSAVTYLGGVTAYSNLITIARFAGNRTVYRPAPPPPPSPGKGHPTWFGAPMSLTKPETWDVPDETTLTTWTSRKGQEYTVHIEGWHNMLVRGKWGLPMHQYPFTLVRARVFDAQHHLVFSRPIWLIVFGPRRCELSLCEIWDAYRQRFDLEHFFRFGKQRLLMDAYHTPDTTHEENWWTLVQLAYLQLWVARGHVKPLPRPWERYLPRFRSDSSSTVSTVSSDSDPTSPRTGTSERQSASPCPCASERQQASVLDPSSPLPAVVQRDLGHVLQRRGIPSEDESTGVPSETATSQRSSSPSPSIVQGDLDRALKGTGTPPEGESVCSRPGVFTQQHVPAPAVSSPLQAPSPSPSDVQRDIGRVLQALGTPAQAPICRGSAPGRAAGERLVMRVRLPVIKKSVQKLHQKQQRGP